MSLLPSIPADPLTPCPQIRAELLQVIVSSMPAGVIVLDGRGYIRQCNAQAQQLLHESLLDEPWNSVVERAFHPRADDGYEVSLRDGRRVSLATAPLHTGTGQLIYLQDLTPTRTLQDQAHQRRRLQELGNMAVSFAHQIRTPLSAAILYASHLSNHMLEREHRQRFSQKLLERLQELERQINDVLLFARGSECQVIGTLCWSDVFQCVEKDLESFQSKHKVSILYPEPDVNWSLRTNLHALKSVFINLIINAVQAHATTITLDVKRQDDVDCVSVDDNGTGIEPGAVKQIYQPFFTTKERGTGLGLAIVHSIMQTHGGRIEVKTKPQKGACFYLYFPRNLQEKSDSQGVAL